jgi:hypothetical protein
MSFSIKLLKHISQFVSHRSLPLSIYYSSTFRHWSFGLFLIFHFSFFIFNCGLNIEDATPPSPPQWVQKSLPEEWPERGIDAHESGGIYLEWEHSLQEDIALYSIYRSIWFDELDSLGGDELVARLNVDLNFQSEYVDRQADIRMQYMYKINCSDVSNNVSEFSDPQFYSLLPQLGVGSMHPNGPFAQLSNRTLSWAYYHGFEMEDYNLTILKSDDSFLMRVIIVPGNYIGDRESWQIPEYVDLDSAGIYKWRLDMSAKYVDGFESAGSETPWARFLYLSD